MSEWTPPKMPEVDDDEEVWKRRAYRFAASTDEHSKRLWCLTLTLMILCGAAVLVAVLVGAMIFMSQNQG